MSAAKRTRVFAFLMACVPFLAGTWAWACQACLEDKIAATYDWQVVSTAKQQGHTVIFAAIQGPLTPGDRKMEERLNRTVSSVAGVDAGTVRVSLSPPALAFAADLRVHSANAMLRAANQRLHAFGLALAIVRVGAPAETKIVLAGR